MKNYEKLSSLFRTLELAILFMIAFDCRGWFLFIVFCVAILTDAAIDFAIREGK